MQTAKAIMQTPDTDLDRSRSQEMRYKATERKRCGRLKIFLGAAPGVGTTGEMIRAGIAKHREGVDVVVAVRKETEALLKELKAVPGYGAALD